MGVLISELNSKACTKHHFLLVYNPCLGVALESKYRASSPVIYIYSLVRRKMIYVLISYLKLSSLILLTVFLGLACYYQALLHWCLFVYRLFSSII